jgi:hypothetical protein
VARLEHLVLGHETNYFRTPGDTSADAAGLPILPGLVRPDEVLDQGIITHALRFTVPATDDTWIFPASHQAGLNNPNLPRMGERFRLKASFNISAFSAANQVILRALKDYGMLVADNGSGWYVQGQPSTRWNDDELSQLKSLRGSDFEAVDLTPRVTSATSPNGSVTQGTVVTINGSNFGGGAGLTKVFFGSLAATSVTVVSDMLIRAVAPAVPSGPVSLKVQSPYGTSNSVTVASFTPPQLTTLTAGDGQVFGLDAQTTLWRFQPGNGSWISAGMTTAKFVVANVGDGLSSTDLVYFLTSDNRLWVWNQQSVTFTGGWLANIWAGDNQIFGIGLDGQVWRDNAVSGWAAGHAWGAEIAVANTRDKNAANDVVFLRGADNSIWVWNQQTWTNTRGWLPNIVAGDNQVFGIGADGQVWRYRLGAGWLASGGYGVQIDVGNKGDGNPANDIVYLRAADNRIWMWTQTAWTYTGRALSNMVAGDGQLFGQASDGQVWRYRPASGPVSGWTASGGGFNDDHLVLANNGDESAGTDVVFLLAPDQSIDWWDQLTWKNSNG